VNRAPAIGDHGFERGLLGQVVVWVLEDDEIPEATPKPDAFCPAARSQSSGAPILMKRKVGIAGRQGDSSISLANI